MAASENRNDGVVLAATAGAVNVRLGGNALKTAVKSFTAGEDSGEPESTQATPGREPELAHLRSVVGLVWRCVVLWMVLLALLTLARLLG
jgi:adenosylcobinamide-phosphate synthase